MLGQALSKAIQVLLDVSAGLQEERPNKPSFWGDDLFLKDEGFL